MRGRVGMDYYRVEGGGWRVEGRHAALCAAFFCEVPSHAVRGAQRRIPSLHPQPSTLYPVSL
jgi:hypothetical protein